MFSADLQDRLEHSISSGKRYVAIASVLEKAIAEGHLKVGDQLPTVRQLSEGLRLSATTVSAAYKLLQSDGLIDSQIGRGTFVASPASPQPAMVQPTGNGPTSMLPEQAAIERRRYPGGQWRKRSLTSSASYLRSAFPNALDCSSGRPDPRLLPIGVLRRAFRSAVDVLEPFDLQYSGPEPIPALVEAILPRLEADGITAQHDDIVVGSSAQQWMMLSLYEISRLSDGPMVVAVEEPGYPTIFDSFERAGHRLVGVEVDHNGAVPDSLDCALNSGAQAVLFTPRAQNPTGASWTLGRRDALAAVIAAHPEVFVIEDDQFADITVTQPGSLLSDPRTEHQTIHIRSFSKAFGPDLRVAVAVARPGLRARLAESKSFADGWTSRLAQSALARILTDTEIDHALSTARDAYAERRENVGNRLAQTLQERGGNVIPGDDGVNVWIHLPPGIESFELVEHAAALGVITAPGDPFFIRPGHCDSVRINAGAVDAAQALVVADIMISALSSRAGPTLKIVSV